jgi:hypothetical protein
MDMHLSLDDTTFPRSSCDSGLVRHVAESKEMLMQTHSVRFPVPAHVATVAQKPGSLSDLAGRSIQILLTLYLLPVLLVVLMVGGMGLAVLALSRLLNVKPINRTV